MTEVAMGYEIRDKIKEPTTITDIGNLKIINKNGMYYLEVEFLGETDTSFVKGAIEDYVQKYIQQLKNKLFLLRITLLWRCL